MILQICLLLVLVCAYHNLRWRRSSGPQPPSPWGLPILGHLPFLGSEPAQKILAWKKTYGPIISLRFGSYSAIAISDGPLIRKAFSLSSLSGRPVLEYYDSLFWNRNGFAFSDGAKADQLRVFVQKKLKGFDGQRQMEDRLIEQVPGLLNLFESHVNKTLGIKKRLGIFIVNALWSVLMSKGFVEDHPEFVKFLECISECSEVAVLKSLAIFIPGLRRIAPNLGGYLDTIKGMSKLHFFIGKQVKEHEESGRVRGKSRDMTDALLDLKDSSSEIDAANVEATVFELFAAGFETTTVAMEWLIFFLTKYSECQGKASREILNVLGTSRLPTLKDRTELPYCEAFILETLRKSSFSPLAAFHRALEDTEFNGYLIPKDTILISNLHAVSHDPELWGDPEEFRPERFLDEQGKLKESEEFMPFGSGKRDCIGKNLAKDLMLLYFVSIVQKYRLEAEGKLPADVGTYGLVTACPQFSFVVRRRDQLVPGQRPVLL